MPKPPAITDDDMNTIDLYLANALSPTDLNEFDRRLATEPGLPAVLTRQRQINAQLRRIVPMPAPELAMSQLNQAINEAGQPVLAGQQNRKYWRPSRIAAAAIAALLLISFTAIWSGLLPFGSASSDANLAASTTPFDLAMADGFLPSMPQSDADLLEITISEKLGTSVILPRGSDFKYLGLRSDLGGSPMAIGLLAKVKDQPVLMMLDRATATLATADYRTITSTPKSRTPGLYRHERFCGPVRCIEFSQSATPLLPVSGKK